MRKRREAGDGEEAGHESTVEGRVTQEGEKKRDGSMKVIYSNVDGVISKDIEIRDMLTEKQPKIVCMSETKLTSNNSSHVLGWKGYKAWREDRKGKPGGGVLILTKEDLRARQIKLTLKRAEIVAVEVETKESEKLLVVCVYMPPLTRAWTQEEHKEMIKELVTLLEKLSDKNYRILITGDFNAKEINWEKQEAGKEDDSWNSKLLDFATEHILTQHVKENTRMRGEDEPTRLDLVFTREKEDVKDLKHLPPLGKSDHMILEWDMVIDQDAEDENEQHKEERYNFSKANYAELRCFFEGFDWSILQTLESVNEKFNKFVEIYKEGVDTCVPKYGQRKMQKKKPWFNRRCEKARKLKDLAWNRARRHSSERAWAKYKEERNEFIRIRREEEIKYERNIVEKVENDPKLFYRHINGKLKARDSVRRLRTESGVVEKDEEICEVLNDKLKSVFTQEDAFTEPEGEEEVEQITDIQFEESELRNMMKKLDVTKAMGPDEISGWVLKNCADQLSAPLYTIIKQSLEEGELPEEWKRANIIPIFKGGDKEEPLNYRPVSLTSVVCKICEKIIRTRWIKYLEERGILSDAQFGFREGRSCVTNLLSFYSRVTDVIQEKEGWVDSIFLDMKKAFDRVPHARLLWKLKSIGRVGGPLLKWMENYLKERKMRTLVRGAASKWVEVTSGVPQGAVLAPLMFLVYINDMPEGVKSYMSLFADDAKVLKPIKNEESCRELQEDLNRLHEWSMKWKMEFNAKKCHVIEFGKSIHRPRGTYRLGGQLLEKSESEKDLGVTIQNNMSPEKHINRIVGGAFALLADIRVAFKHMDENMMKKLIVSLVRPRLEYAQVVWSPHLKKHIHKLERVQRAATRMVPSLKDLPYEERLSKLGLPTLEARRVRGDMIMMYKCVNGLEKIDRDDFIVRDDGRTRGHEYKLRRTRCTRDTKKYCFPNRGLGGWNGLPRPVVSAPTIPAFKNAYDNHMMGVGTSRA